MCLEEIDDFNENIQTLGVLEDGGHHPENGPKAFEGRLLAAYNGYLGWRKALGPHLHGESKPFLGPSKEGVSRVGTTLPGHSSHNFFDVLFSPQAAQIRSLSITKCRSCYISSSN